MKRENKVESTYKKNEKIRAVNLPLQKNSYIIYIESERESNLSSNSKTRASCLSAWRKRIIWKR